MANEHKQAVVSALTTILNQAGDDETVNAAVRRIIAELETTGWQTDIFGPAKRAAG